MARSRLCDGHLQPFPATRERCNSPDYRRRPNSRRGGCTAASVSPVSSIFDLTVAVTVRFIFHINHAYLHEFFSNRSRSSLPGVRCAVDRGPRARYTPGITIRRERLFPEVHEFRLRAARCSRSAYADQSIRAKRVRSPKTAEERAVG